jgi:uncharacterized protein (TIGR02996 family)
MSDKTVKRELLAAVRAEPDADEPRMILADWHMERGNPRGEFIAAMCRLATGGLNPARRIETRKRAEKLLEKNIDTWAAPAAAVLADKKVRATPLIARFNAPGARRRNVVFRRGFIDKVRASASKFLDHGQALLDAELVTALELAKASAKSIQALAASPMLADIQALTVRGQIGDAGALALAESPHLGSLVRLNLKDTGIGDAGAKALAWSSGLGSLRSLSLSGNEIGDDGVEALAGSPVLAGLDRLFLSRNEIGDAGVMALADAPGASRLVILALGGNEELGDEGAQRLLDSRTLSSLERLEVDVCEIGDGMLDALRERWPRLRPRASAAW